MSVGFLRGARKMFEENSHVGGAVPIDESVNCITPFLSGIRPKENPEHPAWKFQKFIFHQVVLNDEYVCVTQQRTRGSWHNYLRESNNFKRWTQVDDAAAWYFALATTRWDLNAKGTMISRGRDNLVRYHALMLDDIGDGEGSKASDPPIPPACKLETSAGNYQWIYRLKAGDDFAAFSAVVE